ncbi:DNA-binding CsgD family transcriptional regulator [Natronocella acetinitrilica]|uniref:DNA-binding CsgD family transcriptional regulator n=1 Tax=Natronocella acetinitrilica TaxID=414046 RepID=A0AAE3G442_9GAMM|nr:LuxR family transcriptional regulator [Natronocella acetinitrilica]MCP1674828.1 DNA-binding CsgD family transcriptional regulator [Natronocella acetinitrilica]
MRQDLSGSVSEFLLHVHDASARLAPEDFQMWTLRELQRHIDFDFAIWGAGDGHDRRLHRASVYNQVETLFQTWEPVKNEDGYADLVIGNTGKTWTLSQVPNVFRTRAYNEHWRLYDAREMLSTMQVDPVTGLHVFVTLSRDRLERRFTEPERRFKNLVTKHLFVAARHNDQAQLGRTGAPAALIDHLGHVHASLPGFIELIVDEWGAAAGRRLPRAAAQDLWQRGHHEALGLHLDAEPAGTRLLVRARRRAALPPSLSRRELEVAWAYANGKSQKMVARELDISPTTVHTHLRRIYQKLGVTDKGALALWLTRHG